MVVTIGATRSTITAHRRAFAFASRYRTARHSKIVTKAILKAEWEADAPSREALAIKRERLRARRAEKEMRGKRRTE